MTSSYEEAELLTKHGWQQVGAGRWMHPGVLAGQERLTTDEAIAWEVKAAVEESKEPVSVVAKGQGWQEEMRNELSKMRAEAERLDQVLHRYQKDLTDLAAILIPEVVAEGKGFTTESLLNAARKAAEPPPLMMQLKSYAQLDEKTVERLQKFADEAKRSGGWQKPVVLFKDKPVACSECGRTWEEPESVLLVRCECGAEVDTRLTFYGKQTVESKHRSVVVERIAKEELTARADEKPEQNCRDCRKPACEYLGQDRKPTDLDCFKPAPELDELPDPWDAEVDRRLKAVEESVQRALIRVHKNAHEINLMKTDLYPKEHPRRKAVDESVEVDNHACMRETLRQIADQPCDPNWHEGDKGACSPCHARSYFENVESEDSQ